jgi:hypothetical protein
MGFWGRTWKEREDEVRRLFGDTEPPGYVTSYSWDDLRLPGGCALAFPPVADNSDLRGAWHKRDHWLHLSLGLTQPLSKKHFLEGKQAGKEYSSFGFEFGILTDEKADWAFETLYALMTLLTDGVDLKWGDRLAFGFHEIAPGKLSVFSGQASEAGVQPVGTIRALVFWPYLFPDAAFTTSTGRAMIYIATGITEEEWLMTKETTTPQLLLLLCKAGVGQRTQLQRPSVLSDPRWRGEWERIKGIGGEAADAELEAGIGQW